MRFILIFHVIMAVTSQISCKNTANSSKSSTKDLAAISDRPYLDQYGNMAEKLEAVKISLGSDGIVRANRCKLERSQKIYDKILDSPDSPEGLARRNQKNLEFINVGELRDQSFLNANPNLPADLLSKIEAIKKSFDPIVQEDNQPVKNSKFESIGLECSNEVAAMPQTEYLEAVARSLSLDSKGELSQYKTDVVMKEIALCKHGILNFSFMYHSRSSGLERAVDIVIEECENIDQTVKNILRRRSMYRFIANSLKVGNQIALSEFLSSLAYVAALAPFEGAQYHVPGSEVPK